MFREPEDAQIDRAGWPWHGLVVDGVLTLPSGRTMPIEFAADGDFGHTSLWDIGLPDQPSITADPDEQWLGKAIIRGGRYFYSGGYSGWQTVSPQYSRPPVYVGGVVRPARDLAANASADVNGLWSVQAEIFVDGVRYQSNLITHVDMGLEAFEFSSMTAGFIDHRWDRGRWLITASVPHGSITRRVALLEARLIAGVGGALSLQLTMLANEASFAELQISLNDTVTITSAQRHTGSQAGAPKTGVYTAHMICKVLFTAFYKLDASVELVYLNADALSTYDTTDVTQQINTRIWKNSGTLWLDCSLGVTSSISFESAIEYYGNSSVSPAVATQKRTDKINGVTVRMLEEPTSFFGTTFREGPVPAWPTFDFTQSLDRMLGSDSTWGSSLFAGAASPSNCIHQAAITSVFGLQGGGTRRIFERSSAITPGGIHPGVASFDSQTSPGNSAGSKFLLGSYNPITGQVIRNQTDHFYCWV
jgi:hypothetical protein